MGKIESVSIELEKQSRTYFAGDTVTGTVNLKLTGGETKIRFVYLDIIGLAQVKWKELKNFGSKNSYYKTYSSEETYISVNKKSIMPVSLYKADKSYAKLTDGPYSFPFTFVLPANLPTSFSQNCGSIIYKITATVDSPWSLDIQDEVIFKVIANYDLSQKIELKKPFIVNERVLFNTYCCSSAPIDVIFGVKKQAFASGELINVILEINNTSNTKLDQMRVILVEETTFKAVQKLKMESYHIAISSQLDPVPANDCKRYENLKVKIPKVCTSSNEKCSIMTVKHFIEFSPSGSLDTTSNLIIPITIGSLAPKVDSDLSDESIFQQVNRIPDNYDAWM